MRSASGRARRSRSNCSERKKITDVVRDRCERHSRNKHGPHFGGSPLLGQCVHRDRGERREPIMRAGQSEHCLAQRAHYRSKFIARNEFKYCSRA